MEGGPNLLSLQNPKNIYMKLFYLYLQSSSASRQPKYFGLDVFANPGYRVQSHPNA